MKFIIKVKDWVSSFFKKHEKLPSPEAELFAIEVSTKKELTATEKKLKFLIDNASLLEESTYIQVKDDSIELFNENSTNTDVEVVLIKKEPGESGSTVYKVNRGS